MKYSIIIPIFNEISRLKPLLNTLQEYNKEGHEILIINDGSNDGSKEILVECDFINLINIYPNQGKGIAIVQGLRQARNDKIIIFDGDLELHPNDIKKLMILDKNKNSNSVLGNRFNSFHLGSIWDLGNKLLTITFNWLNDSNVKDALCCAKAFYKSDIQINGLNSKKFEIDVEITSQLVKIHSSIKNINLKYERRNISQGKKLRLRNSFSILIKMIEKRRILI